METIVREFTVRDSYDDVATLKISQDSIINLIGWLKKLNLPSMGRKMTLWTYSWLKDEFAKSEGHDVATEIETDMFDDDFYRHTEEGNLFQVTIHVIDNDDVYDEWFWLNFMFGFDEEGNEQVMVSHESPHFQESTMEQYTGHSESYVLNSWKEGMREMQTILQKAFPAIPTP